MHIICTVTNDLHYDQRMQRICTTLVESGHSVLLLGRLLPNSHVLEQQIFQQKRLKCRFQKGVMFYAEYNLRLFFFLLFTKFDAVCSVDLDTLLPGCLASVFRRKKRVFDAHEYFTETPEVVHRPAIKTIWAILARVCLLFYKNAYTVGPALAAIFSEKYRIPFGVVRNVPFARKQAKETRADSGSEKIILYQGALNEGRGLETAIKSMQKLRGVQLWIAGEGDLSAELRQLASDLNVLESVRFLGFVKPKDLKELSEQAWLGLNLLENRGLSYYYSLANKFFDYIQAEVPSINMQFPEYQTLVAAYPCAILLPNLSVKDFVVAVEALQNQPERYQEMQAKCRLAATEFTWEQEQKVLLDIWAKV